MHGARHLRRGFIRPQDWCAVGTPVHGDITYLLWLARYWVRLQLTARVLSGQDTPGWDNLEDNLDNILEHVQGRHLKCLEAEQVP